MKRNEALYDARLSLGLSRKEAAKILGTRPFILKNYEDGYLYLKDKKARQFALAYGFGEDAFLIDDKGYFAPIDYEKGKEKKELFPRIKNALASLPGRIITSILLAVSSILAIAGGINYSYTYRNRDSYLPKEYVEIYSSVYSGGQTTLFPSMVLMMDTQDAYKHSFPEIDEGFSVLVPVSDGCRGLVCFSYDEVLSESQTSTFSLICLSIGSCCLVYDIIDASSEEPLSSSFAVYSPFTQEIDYMLAKDEALLKPYYEKTKAMAERYLANYSWTVDSLFSTLCLTNEQLLELRVYNTYAMFGFGLLAAVVFLLLVYGVVRQGQLRKKGLYSKVEEFVQDEEIVGSSPREIPRSFDPAPFVSKEDYLRYFFLAIFFIGGLTGFFGRMQNYGWISQEAYSGIANVLSYFSGIGTFMVFFLKLEAIISRRNTFLSFLTCLSISTIFYIAEVFLTVLFGGYGVLGSYAMSLLPSNLFTGLASLALFAFFLLKEPKNAKRWQSILFHLGALFPLAYLIAGFVILETWDTISPFLNAALNGGLFEVCVIGVVYIFFIFLSRRYAFHRYGIKGGEEFLTGSHYTLLRNIVLASVIGLLVIFNYIFEDLNLWTLNKNIFFLLLIPVFLLYRTRVPKSTAKGELLFDGGYIVLLVLPYILSFILSLFH